MQRHYSFEEGLANIFSVTFSFYFLFWLIFKLNSKAFIVRLLLEPSMQGVSMSVASLPSELTFYAVGIEGYTLQQEAGHV